MYSTANRLVSVVGIGAPKIRVTAIQYLLKHFLSMGYATSDMGLRRVYWEQYNALMDFIVASPDSPLAQLSVNVYGTDNISLSRHVILNRLDHDITGVALLTVPCNYYPARGKPQPCFDVNAISLYRESGAVAKK